MSKPAEVTQRIWNDALELQRNLYGNRADCISDFEFDDNTKTLARYLMAAEQRGIAEQSAAQTDGAMK